ncbi:MAG: FtsH protease activity modulator HflK [Candidatus Wallbacteria bacterium]|nr:FtsH protease activity modulator HflK [Candidatus Wallbacteria bacterium]
MKDFEDAKIVNEKLEEFKQKGGRFVRTNLILLFLMMLVVYLLSGFFVVEQYQLGVVRRFGKMVRTVEPGLRYHLPYPVEVVDRPEVAKVQRIEIGFKTEGYEGTSGRYSDSPAEADMLTGDINIVKADFIVQYKIKDPVAYLFNVYKVDETVKKAAEAAMRQIAANHNVDDILTEKKEEIQEETRKLMQEFLDTYEAGTDVQAVKLQDVVPPDAVVAAFKDVASAKEDKERFINEAQGYQNELLPKAEGDAAKMVREAEGYMQEKINISKGEAEKFTKVREEYRKAAEITRIRLYLETAEKVLARTRKIITTGQANNDLMKLFHLNAPLGGEK